MKTKTITIEVSLLKHLKWKFQVFFVSTLFQFQRFFSPLFWLLSRRNRIHFAIFYMPKACKQNARKLFVCLGWRHNHLGSSSASKLEKKVNDFMIFYTHFIFCLRPFAGVLILLLDMNISAAFHCTPHILHGPAVLTVRIF